MAQRQWQLQGIGAGGAVTLSSRPVVCLRIALSEGRSVRLASMPYRLSVKGRLYEEHEGKTDEHGILEAMIPVEATEGVLEFNGIRVPLVIGELPPPDTTRGVQARLNNLGYEPGRIDGVAGPRTIAGVRAFQRDAKRRVTGEVDAATRAALVDAHGC